MLDKDSLHLLAASVERLESAFDSLPTFTPEYDRDAVAGVLNEVAERLADDNPYFHPCYAGHMLKPPHPVARLAYALAMYLNPNNQSFEAGRASSAMEREAVEAHARLCGWRDYLGHLTTSGTLANLEALWGIGQLHPGKVVLASAQAHYTHGRISNVLQLPFEAVATDACCRMDVAQLEQRLARGDVGAVVVTLGTTAAGAVDPLAAILPLRERYGFHVHLDAAYGGYFKLVEKLPPDPLAAYACMGQADSIVIDPHKHGLQPYGCGCVLFRDPTVRRFYEHDSAYTYLAYGDMHLGKISLECSRAGAAAVALWATQRLLPPVPGGAFATMLTQCHEAALELHRRLQQDPRCLTLFPPDLDIVCWAPRAPSLSAISARSRVVFEAAANSGLHLALVHYPAQLCLPHWPGVAGDCEQVLCLRSCLMKPEHYAWLDTIWDVLDGVLGA